MIIESAPRLRDETLGAYPPSPNRTLENPNFSEGPPEDIRFYNRLAESSEHCDERKRFYDREKTRADLLDCERSTSAHHVKNRRTSHRGHPYDRDSKEKRNANKLNFLLSALSNHKCPLLLRSFHREKAIELLQRFSPILKCKSDRRENKFQNSSIPIFTANANENNDNCPGTAQEARRFAITKQLTTSPPADDICDVEIEDLSENDVHTTTNSQIWRQRRRSFNTNPLSSSSFICEKSPVPLCLDELISTAENARNQVFGNQSRKNFSTVAEFQTRKHKFDNGETRQNRGEGSESPVPSIEKLVEFFEYNSAAIQQREDSKNCSQERQLSSQSQRTSQLSFPRISKNFDSTHHRRKVSNYKELKRPSTSPTSEISDREHGNISADFPHFLPKDWDSVIRISSGHIPHSVIPPRSGGVYNNNGNAASTPPESSLLWPGSKYGTDKQFPHIGHFETPPHKATPFPSPALFPRERERCSSSLGRFSLDTDFKSTRVLNWPGTRPSTAFDRHKKESPFRVDNLIDLQTTSTRSNHWSGRKGTGHFTDNSKKVQHNFSYNQSPRRVDRTEERFQNSQYQVERKESQAACLSANNHHNAPWFSQDERSYQEKNFLFEHLQLHHRLLDPFLEKRSAPFLNSDRGEMGCIQSIAKAKVSPDRCHHSVIVEDIQAAIDRTPTEIEEKSPIVLRYRTPYFRASAHVIVPPIPRKETWTVGWIQACDSMKFINQYGNLGSSSWEIPALKDRLISAVSDSDGVSYPWYGNTTEIATVEGPTEASRSLTLRMNDNFYPSVTWDIPVSEGSEAHLTHIVRDQSFTTWLAAVNQTTGRLEVLRTVKWHFYLEIDVDPKKELGKRACIVSPLVQKQPIVLKTSSDPIYISSPHRGGSNGSAGSRQKRLNRRPGAGGDNNSNNHTNFIPKSALVRPSANNAQTLIWRPARDVPVIVVPAKEEYKENSEVVWFTRTPTMHGHDHNVRILSLQEMSQLKKNIS